VHFIKTNFNIYRSLKANIFIFYMEIESINYLPIYLGPT
jgi:hypothetical protein